jgi:hypothetical protein
MSMKKIYFIIFLISNTSFAQNLNASFGGGLGLGSFMGDFPSQTTLGSKIFLEIQSPFTFPDRIQIHFTAAQKVERFLPGTYNYDYYSYFVSFGISGLFKQYLNENIFINEGVGFIYLNDRSFSDINEWNFGMLISFNIGAPLSKNLDISFLSDYGITFNNTNVSNYQVMVMLTHKI